MLQQLLILVISEIKRKKERIQFINNILYIFRHYNVCVCAWIFYEIGCLENIFVNNLVYFEWQCIWCNAHVEFINANTQLYLFVISSIFLFFPFELSNLCSSIHKMLVTAFPNEIFFLSKLKMKTKLIIISKSCYEHLVHEKRRKKKHF